MLDHFPVTSHTILLNSGSYELVFLPLTHHPQWHLINPSNGDLLSSHLIPSSLPQFPTHLYPFPSLLSHSIPSLLACLYTPFPSYPYFLSPSSYPFPLYNLPPPSLSMTFPPISSGYPSSDVKYEYGQKTNESVPLSAEEVRERELRFQQFLGRQQQSALKNQQHLKSVNCIKYTYLRTVLYCTVTWEIELILSFYFRIFTEYYENRNYSWLSWHCIKSVLKYVPHNT